MKKFLATIIAVCMVMALTVGCGGKKNEPASSTVPDAPSSLPLTPEDNEPIMPVPDVDLPDETYGGNDSEGDTGFTLDENTNNEADTETNNSDWFSQQGLKITPQGEVTAKFGLISPDGNTDTGDFTTTASVTVTDMGRGAPDGFKQLYMRAEVDIQGYGMENPTDRYSLWRSVFDRYTGTSMEFTGVIENTVFGDNYLKNDSQIFYVDDKEILVHVVFAGYIDENNRFVSEIYLICPEDYDGAVFQLGFNSAAQREKYREVAANGVTTIDNLPYYGEDQLYFSIDNK